VAAGRWSSRRLTAPSCRREDARASLKVIAVRIALAADGVRKVPEKAPEALNFLGGRRSDGRAGRDMFSEFIQRHVEVFGSRPIQSQHDIVFHAGDLTVMPRVARQIPVVPPCDTERRGRPVDTPCVCCLDDGGWSRARDQLP
jgi:hypothetical protein